MIPCRFAQRAENAVEVDALTGDQRQIEGPMLCGWAMDEAPDQLLNVPRWLSRNALAGHLLKYPSDCEGCPAYQAKGGTV
jgi:hypothetical protein